MTDRAPPPVTLSRALDAAARDLTCGITLVPDRVGGAEEHRSYAALEAAARAVATHLRAMGVKEGDRVLVVLPTSFDFVVVFFALVRLGAIPVPAYPPTGLGNLASTLENLARIGRHAGIRWGITSRALRTPLAGLALSVPTLEAVVASGELPLDGSGPRADEARDTPEAIAFLQYTSGSTGHPKGVALSHANVIANIHAIGVRTEVSPADRTVSWLPLYHDMGLIGCLLFSVVFGLPLALMSPLAFLSRPVRWLQTITKHRGTMSPAPNFAYALCVQRIEAEERGGLDLGSWRLAFNGAERVRPETIAAFAETFGPVGFRASTMYPVYGLAEASLAVTAPKPGAPVSIAHVDAAALADGRAVATAPGALGVAITGLGAALPDHEVVVTDDDGRRLPDRRLGRILVRGPSVMTGYFRDPEATAQALGEGWLSTGDRGFLVEGELFVTGREKDLIIRGGRNHHAEDLERWAESVEGIRRGRTVAFTIDDEARGLERVVLVCERKDAEKDEAQIVEQISRAVFDATGLAVDEVVLVEPGVLPRTSSGKLQRQRTRALYASDALEAPRAGGREMARVFARSAAGLMTLVGRRLRGR